MALLLYPIPFVLRLELARREQAAKWQLQKQEASARRGVARPLTGPSLAAPSPAAPSAACEDTQASDLSPVAKCLRDSFEKVADPAPVAAVPGAMPEALDSQDSEKPQISGHGVEATQTVPVEAADAEAPDEKDVFFDESKLTREQQMLQRDELKNGGEQQVDPDDEDEVCKPKPRAKAKAKGRAAKAKPKAKAKGRAKAKAKAKAKSKPQQKPACKAKAKAKGKAKGKSTPGKRKMASVLDEIPVEELPADDPSPVPEALDEGPEAEAPAAKACKGPKVKALAEKGKRASGAGKATFARRYQPTDAWARAKWLAIKDSFELRLSRLMHNPSSLEVHG